VGLDMNLPRGSRPIEDVTLIEDLIKNPTFIESIESDLGKIENIYPEWTKNVIIVELLNGQDKEIDITWLLEQIKKFKYEKEIEQ
jgi:hypothetical protein